MFVCVSQRKNKLNGNDKVMCTIETNFSKKIEHKIIGDFQYVKYFLNLLFGNFQPTQKKEKHNFKKKNHYLRSEFFLSLFTKKNYLSKKPFLNLKKKLLSLQRNPSGEGGQQPHILKVYCKNRKALDKRELGSTCEHASESGLQ